MNIITAAAALPQLPTIWAVDIYAAQGLKLEGEARAAVIARADFFEANGMSREVKLNVVNPRTGIREGQIIVNI